MCDTIERSLIYQEIRSRDGEHILAHDTRKSWSLAYEAQIIGVVGESSPLVSGIARYISQTIFMSWKLARDSSHADVGRKT